MHVSQTLCRGAVVVSLPAARTIKFKIATPRGQYAARAMHAAARAMARAMVISCDSTSAVPGREGEGFRRGFRGAIASEWISTFEGLAYQLRSLF